MTSSDTDANNYHDPARVVCTFTYEELQEISESLLFTRENDPDVDRDYSLGVRKKVLRITKKVRQRNPSLKTT